MAEKKVEESFWKAALYKIVENVISLKTWGIISGLWVSTWLVTHSHISGGNWTTFNVANYGVIYGMREVFKTATVRTWLTSSGVHVAKKIKQLGGGRIKV